MDDIDSLIHACELDLIALKEKAIIREQEKAIIREQEEEAMKSKEITDTLLQLQDEAMKSSAITETLRQLQEQTPVINPNIDSLLDIEFLIPASPAPRRPVSSCSTSTISTPKWYPNDITYTKTIPARGKNINNMSVMGYKEIKEEPTTTYDDISSSSSSDDDDDDTESIPPRSVYEEEISLQISKPNFEEEDIVISSQTPTTPPPPPPPTTPPPPPPPPPPPQDSIQVEKTFRRFNKRLIFYTKNGDIETHAILNKVNEDICVYTQNKNNEFLFLNTLKKKYLKKLTRLQYNIKCVETIENRLILDNRRVCKYRKKQ